MPLELRPAEGVLHVLRTDLDELAEKLDQVRSTGYNLAGIMREATDAGVEKAVSRALTATTETHLVLAWKRLAESATAMEAAAKSQARLVDVITEARGKQ